MSPRVTPNLPVSKKWLVDGFCWYTKRMVAKHFTSFGVQIERAQLDAIPDEAPIIVFVNHPSWWDPITAMLLREAYLPNRTFYAPIDSIALEKYRIMAKLGFYGLRMKSLEGTSEFLSVTKLLLQAPNVSLWITPEAQFCDSRDYSQPLMPGLSHLATKIPSARFVPLALEYPFWNESRPQIFARLGTPIWSEAPLSKSEWNERLTAGLRSAQRELSESVVSRDPSRFSYLIAGRSVRLSWYDYGRSWNAWLRGKPFDPRHA